MILLKINSYFNIEILFIVDILVRDIYPNYNIIFNVNIFIKNYSLFLFKYINKINYFLNYV